MASLAEEKALVAKYKNQPFALVAIDSSGTPAAVRKKMKQNGITWRMVIDGGMEGPIATKWNVHMWPEIYVIDQRGVIRHKMDLPDHLPEKIAKLMEILKKK